MFFLCANVVLFLLFLSHLILTLTVVIPRYMSFDPGLLSAAHLQAAEAPRRARGRVQPYLTALSQSTVSLRSRLASQTIVTRTQNAKKRGAGPKTVPPPRGSGLKLQLYSYSYSTHCLSAATAFCAASSRSSAERMARPEFLMISLP